MNLEVTSAVWLSLRVAALACVLALPFATALGYLLSRREFRAKALLNTLVMAPLVLPPVVTGLALLRLLGPNTPMGRALNALGIRLAFNAWAAVIAAMVVGFPLFVSSARAAFDAVDVRYEELAWSLGSTRWQSFVRVTLPLAWPGLAAGAMLAFARALGEFGATVIFAGNIEGETRTIALAVYALLDLPGGESRVFWLASASVVLSAGSLVAHESLVRWQRRRLDLEA
ncbi:MAG: molybdate ABC transporter permease subunit [Deltaproteobacteria bacterium]|nr:molybdate ABC transporter permease subunit [Deltaproteobacteria bacterium]